MPAGAGLEPDVEDVHFLAELGRLPQVAHGCLRARARPGVRVPGVGGLPAEELDDAAVDLSDLSGWWQRVAEEDGDGHAPDALAGDAPVGAGGDHVRDAFLAPGRVPGDRLDLVEGALAEGGGAAFGRGMGVSMPMNHCSVARTMTGLWQRQQCG